MPEKTKNRSDSLLLFFLNNKALILLIIMFVLSAVITGGKSVTGYNLTSLMRQVPAYSIVAIGYTIIFGSGQMDLSVGRIVSLCGVIYASLSLTLPLPVAMLGAVLTGMVCEFFNGFLIRFFKIPGFVLTLATSEIFRGIAHIITEGRNIAGISDTVVFIGQGQLFGVIPVAFIIALVMILLVTALLGKTIFGRHILATGGNGEAAEVSGIRVEFVRVAAYICAGICMAVGAVVLTGRVGFASPIAGEAYTMDCIAAVVIGGTPMRGGKTKVIGTLFGMSLIIVINNMLNLMGTNTYWQWIAKGIIIIIAIILDALSEKFVNFHRARV